MPAVTPSTVTGSVRRATRASGGDLFQHWPKEGPNMPRAGESPTSPEKERRAPDNSGTTFNPTTPIRTMKSYQDPDPLHGNGKAIPKPKAPNPHTYRGGIGGITLNYAPRTNRRAGRSMLSMLLAAVALGRH